MLASKNGYHLGRRAHLSRGRRGGQRQRRRAPAQARSTHDQPAPGRDGAGDRLAIVRPRRGRRDADQRRRAPARAGEEHGGVGGRSGARRWSGRGRAARAGAHHRLALPVLRLRGAVRRVGVVATSVDPDRGAVDHPLPRHGARRGRPGAAPAPARRARTWRCSRRSSSRTPPGSHRRSPRSSPSALDRTTFPGSGGRRRSRTCRLSRCSSRSSRASCPAFTSDNFLVNLAAAEAGAGAIVLGRVTHRFSRARGIVPIDLDMGPGKRGMLCLVCPKSALDIPRVRLVADLLQEQVKSIRRY